MIIYFAGWPAAIGLFIYVILIVAVMVLTVKNGALRTKTGKEADGRLSVLEELLKTMLVVKMYCWEYLFLKRLVDRRKAEVEFYKLQARLLAITQSFTFMSSHVLIILIYSVAFYMKNTEDFFTTSTVFTVVMLSTFIVGRSKLLKAGVFHLSTISKATMRIQEALLLPESIAVEARQDCVDTLEFISYACSYSSREDYSKAALQDINFKLSKGETLGIIGPVGSGKSTLLNSLLDETHELRGEKFVPSKMSITTQEPWIFGGTVQQNIVMNLDLDENRYRHVINAACLCTDLENFADGDQTIVGEKGVTLSGGQRARVSLARCLYADADLYVLDDPLAAVDPTVAKQIYQRAVKDFLKDKMVILITHQHQFLVDADKIMYLEDGKQVACGSYGDIMALQTKFIGTLLTKTDTNNDQSKTELSKVEITKNLKNEKEEQSSVGLIKLKDLLFYIKSGRSFLLPLLYLLLKICVHCGIVFYEIQLGVFANTAGTNLCSENSVNDTCPIRMRDIEVTHDSFLWYSVSYLVIFALEVITSFYFFDLIVGANENLHNLALLGVLKSPMRFFNTNSVGRILNRFSQDLGRADNLLPLTASDTIFILFSTLGALVLAVYLNWLNIVLVLPLAVYLIWLRQYYASTGREVKRLESMSKSPVYNYVSETISGRSVLKAMKLDQTLIRKFMEAEDEHTSVHRTFILTRRWLGFRIEVLISITLLLVTIVFVELTRSSKIGIIFSAGDVGTTLNTFSNLLGWMGWGVRQSVETETNLTSVERLIHYSQLESEKDTISSKSKPVTVKDLSQMLRPKNESNLDFSGDVRFDKVSFNYYENGPLVIKDVSLVIPSGQKVGIVGRTGAGKSSLISSLFRISNICAGKLSINGVDLLDTKLADVRRALSIIPQTPTLLTDTIRANVDPTLKIDDEKVWTALRQVQLEKYVKGLPKQLDNNLEKSGDNLSTGQKQLFCLARALLKKTKILLIDEATANVDPYTDKLIQETIRSG